MHFVCSFCAGFCIGWVIGRMVIRLKKRNAFDMDIVPEENPNDDGPDAVA